MRYQVPQFIEVEDKIFGPFTFKQFAYLAGAAGVTTALLLTTPLYVAIPAAVPFVALGAALAFYKVHNRPFIDVLESAVRYGVGNKLYLWRQRTHAPEASKEKPSGSSHVSVPALSQSKLKDLSWSLDIKESLYADTVGEGRNRQ